RPADGRGQGLLRPPGRGRGRRAQPRPDRLRAHRLGAAPGRVRPLSAFDLFLLRLARTIGHTPAGERAVRSFSLLGEHAALWLVLGGAGIAVDAPRRGRWRRAVVSVATAYVANTGLKVAVPRRRPPVAGLAPAAGHAPRVL